MDGKRILLIVGGGIAAYRALDIVRGIRRGGGSVTPVLTRGGAHFVTALSLAALSESKVHDDLFSVTEEAAMGHIELSRSADIIVVCPATADLLAKMAAGIADDLATTLLLATDTPVLAIPAMNVRMWEHPATIANIALLRSRGVTVIDPDEGVMACGEFGRGRLPPVDRLVAEIAAALATGPKPLAGRHALVTAGPTHEAIDPVRYIANRSSGKQGFAVAQALAELGAKVTLVSGPVALVTPPGVIRVDVESARDMAAAVDAALPADIAVLVAAVADWRVEAVGGKLKKARWRTRAGAGRKPRHPAAPRRSRPAPGPGWSSDSRRKPTRCSPTPRPSAFARAATGWSPTTSPATCSAATATAST